MREWLPEVSVVMSVYNGGRALEASLFSILGQSDVDLEFVVVDDGSTDGSSDLLDGVARGDSRLRVVRQANAGLTQALARGCDMARSEFIARQDVGDISKRERLSRQLACIREHPEAAFVSCGTRFVGPMGETLYEVVRSEGGAQERLLTLDLAKFAGPSSHPSTLFRRSLYEDVGGYRGAFYFGQDIDLWIRLAERGRHVVMQDILYQASITVGSLSSANRTQQFECARLIMECTRARRSGESEAEFLAEASLVRPNREKGLNRLGRARSLYFIGECLRQRNDPDAKRYFLEALSVFPLHLRSLARLMIPS